MTDKRLPFHRHLKWLVLEGMSLEDVRSYYDSIQMAQPTREYFEAAEAEVRGLIVPPFTKRRLKQRLYDAGDQKVWAKHGFEEVYLQRLGRQDWGELGRVLNHPVMRVALECCLVARVSAEDLAQLLPSVYALPLSEGSIALYQRYFWDHEQMGRNAWTSYMKLIAEDRYTYTRLHMALTRPQEEVLHAVGLPSRAQFGTMLKNIMNTANYRFEYYARQQTPEAQREARHWAKLLMDAGVRHEKFGATDATDFSKLIQTEFEYIDQPIPNVTPEMLADVKPKLEAAKRTVEDHAPALPDAVDQPNDRDDL